MKKSLTALCLALCLALAACGAPAAPTPTPAPTAAPTPAPTPDPVAERAEALLAGMDLREKLCQLLVVRPEALTGEAAVTEAGEALGEALAAWPVGGLILGLDNLVTQAQTRALIAGAQGFSETALLICADEEGGNVGRLMYKLDTTYFHDMYSYRAQGPGRAWANAYVIGADMLACGFNTDLAPVADVWTNPDNRVIGPRAYSDDYAEAAELVAAAVEGFRAAGALCCLKHFPGHGDTLADTHEGPATVDRSLEALYAGELLPFLAGMEAGADMVMTGHLLVPDVDADLPASLSPALTAGLLREKLGWDGVVVTDSLDMGALDAWTMPERCLLALQAGADLLLGVDDIPAAVEALEAAVADGRLDAARVDESVLRVLRLKLTRGLAA